MIGASLEHYGEYSQCEIDFILSFLSDRSVVYDVGANIGYHTTAFATRAQRVYAFEPHPGNYALLEKNTEAFDNVFLGQYAVSNARSTCYISDYDPAKVSNFGAVRVVDDNAGIPVTAIDLDTAGLMLPDFIKIATSMDEFCRIHFTSADIVRSSLVKQYIIAKENLGY
jgi:FkbM family methyltransferase